MCCWVKTKAFWKYGHQQDQNESASGSQTNSCAYAQHIAITSNHLKLGGLFARNKQKRRRVVSFSSTTWKFLLHANTDIMKTNWTFPYYILKSVSCK